jgi:hypothetical protein
VAQVQRVVDASIHSHAAERIVDVRRVSRQKHAPDAVVRRHALVNPIERAVHCFISFVPRKYPAQPLLRRLFGKNLLVALVMRRKEAAPQTRHFEQHAELVGVGDVVDVAQPVEHRSDIERRGDNEKALREGHAFEVDADGAAHRAIRAVGADEVVA